MISFNLAIHVCLHLLLHVLLFQAGKTPYAIAEEGNKMEILSLLESYKRNVVDKRKSNAAIRDKANCTVS